MSMRSSRSMLDMPHWTRASPATARTAAIIGTHSETECRCRIEAPAATHRSASAATSAMASGYASSGLSQLLFGVAVITSGGISGAIYRPLSLLGRLGWPGPAGLGAARAGLLAFEPFQVSALHGLKVPLHRFLGGLRVVRAQVGCEDLVVFVRVRPDCREEGGALAALPREPGNARGDLYEDRVLGGLNDCVMDVEVARKKAHRVVLMQFGLAQHAVDGVELGIGDPQRGQPGSVGLDHLPGLEE